MVIIIPCYPLIYYYYTEYSDKILNITVCLYFAVSFVIFAFGSIILLGICILVGGCIGFSGVYLLIKINDVLINIQKYTNTTEYVQLDTA